jgi:hypothetical protein
MRSRALITASAGLLLIGLIILLGQSDQRSCGKVTVSFLGYTNLPNGRAISALISVNNNDSVPIRFGLSSETEQMQEVWAVVAPFPTAAALPCGSSSVYAVEAPAGHSKWRVRLRYFRCTAKERLYNLAWNRQIPQKLGSSWPNLACPYPQVTNSIWLTQTSPISDDP